MAAEVYVVQSKVRALAKKKVEGRGSWRSINDIVLMVEAMKRGEIRRDEDAIRRWERWGYIDPPVPWCGLPLAAAAALLLLWNIGACLRLSALPLAGLRPAWWLLLMGILLQFLHVRVEGNFVSTMFAWFLPFPALVLLALGGRGRVRWAPLLLALVAVAVAVFFRRTMYYPSWAPAGFQVESKPWFLVPLVAASLSIPWLTRAIRREAGGGLEPDPGPSRIARALASDRAAGVAFLGIATAFALGFTIVSLLFYFSSTTDFSYHVRWVGAAAVGVWLAWALAALRYAVDRRVGTPSLPARAWAWARLRLRRRGP